MKMSDEGRKRLTQREGVRLNAYKDSVGVWTIGIGHTSAAGPPNVTPGLTITAQECDAIFKRDLVQYEQAVTRAIRVPLAQHQFDALVSFGFNVGTGGFARSTVVKRINAGDMEGAAQAFMLWTKPPEITGRRRSEVVQFRTPYPASIATVAKTAARDGGIAGGATGAAQGAEKTVSLPVDQGINVWEVLAWAVVIAIVVGAASFAWRWWKARRDAKAQEAAAEDFAATLAVGSEDIEAQPAGVDADALAAEIVNKVKGSASCQQAVTEAMVDPADVPKQTKARKPRRAVKGRRSK